MLFVQLMVVIEELDSSNGVGWGREICNRVGATPWLWEFSVSKNYKTYFPLFKTASQYKLLKRHFFAWAKITLKLLLNPSMELFKKRWVRLSEICPVSNLFPYNFLLNNTLLRLSDIKPESKHHINHTFA